VLCYAQVFYVVALQTPTAQQQQQRRQLSQQQQRRQLSQQQQRRQLSQQQRLQLSQQSYCSNHS
jgi:hypothetical protein